jgi:hypothetical protein
VSTRSRTIRAAAVIGAGAVALTLTACTSSSTSSPATSAAASSAAASSAATASAPQAFEAVDCETLGLDPFFTEVADCGYVTVPENRTGGSDRTIKLAVLRIKAIGDNPGLPVVRGSGGPGGPGMTATQAVVMLHQPLLQNHDFV